MTFKYSTATLAAALGAMAVGVSAASASVIYDWSFTSSADNGAGTFTTAALWTPAGEAITGFTGVIDGQSITALSGYAAADNKIYSNFPFVSQGGVSLTTAADTYNIANINNAGAPGVILESVDPSGTSTGHPIEFSVSVAGGVPEPASWALALVGFGGLGAVLRSRKRTALAA